MKGFCSNGVVQVRLICLNCKQAIGDRLNIPHREVPDIDALPVLFDHRPQQSLPFGE